MAEFVYQFYKARKAHGDKVILDDVTVGVYPGAKIGVVGPNGAGKSTLLKVMAGLEDVSNGEARLTPGYSVGILQQEPAGFVAAVRARMLAGVDLDPAEIEQLIDKRNRARADKDWATSDEVRDYLLAHGVALKDSPEGTTWEARER